MTVEFILILPMLLAVMFASVELSRAWMTMNLVTSAAREAVRAGVVAAPTNVAAAGNARLDALLGAGNWFGPGVSCSGSPCAPNDQVTANVSVNFFTLFPGYLFMLPQPMVLQQTAAMRYE